MEEKHLQMSESFFLTAILAIVGGFLDSYSYLMRGHVFANAQTGNIVLFGVNLQKRDFTQAFYTGILLFCSNSCICCGRNSC